MSGTPGGLGGPDLMSGEDKLRLKSVRLQEGRPAVAEVGAAPTESGAFFLLG